MKSAVKKYMKDLFIAFTLYTFAIFGSNLILQTFEIAYAFQILLALLPVLPIILVIRAVLVFTRTWDELQRKKAMESTLISFLLVGFGTFSYGFLEGIGFPHLSVIWVFPMLFVTQVLGQLYVSRKY